MHRRCAEMATKPDAEMASEMHMPEAHCQQFARGHPTPKLMAVLLDASSSALFQHL